jgi:2-amino-4-hydroxy-6-hydroxymethyldihydropteridine diphosphokinase
LLEGVGSIVATSSVYETQPWKMEDETDFLNQVLLLETNLWASEVMNTILEIESLLGRVRTQQKYEPRTIDIDILFFNNEVISEPNLVVPHPFIAQRRFIVEPMAEIAGDYIHPVLKKTMVQLTSECQDKNRIRKVVTK